jgi:hypothetical protein
MVSHDFILYRHSRQFLNISDILESFRIIIIMRINLILCSLAKSVHIYICVG